MGPTWSSRERIRDFAMQLFRRLQSVHRLPPQYADWLEAAAMLHEVGAYINRSGRRRHTHYIIANSELFGYTPVQRRVIAAIARYVGNSLPTAGDAVIQMVPRADQVQVPKAVALLRSRALSIRDVAVPSASCTYDINQDGPVQLSLTPASPRGSWNWSFGRWNGKGFTSSLSSDAISSPSCAESFCTTLGVMNHLRTPGRRSSFSTLATPPFFISTAVKRATVGQYLVHELRHAGIVPHNHDRRPCPCDGSAAP